MCIEVHMDSPNKLQKMAAKTKWPSNHKTDHNSLNFQARIYRFYIVVQIEIMQITHFGKQNGRQITKLINFQDRSSRFCMVVHIDLPLKLAKFFKRGVAPRGRSTCDYTIKWAELSH